MDAWIGYINASECLPIADQLFRPKTHFMYHQTQRSLWMGNPFFYACFLDESLNKTLKRAVRLCHQQCFESQAFCKIEECLRIWQAKRQRVA